MQKIKLRSRFLSDKNIERVSRMRDFYIMSTRFFIYHVRILYSGACFFINNKRSFYLGCVFYR